MPFTNQLRIHLSLVSHTNIGKTTLARTLLMRDVGEVADRAHVTETTDDYVLARDTAGCELVLWDTPGFGNSVALARRLAGRSNPLGWFLSEVWDRMTNKAFWLNQRAIRHVRDISSVVLYLVNATELPKKAPYITAEMQILSWIGKPVIVLLNQMGQPKTKEEEQADIEAWREAMQAYPFVREILPMDAFARCWVQEAALFDAIGKSLPVSLHAAFETLRDVWVRARRALYRSSVDAMARHMWKLLQARELVEVPSLKDHVISFATQLGIL
ncbi:MAG: GTPase domain-containing protein, partial [Sutterella sp.]